MSGTVWIFDLDNTLHDATPHIFPHINRSMTEYMMQHLDLNETDASALRRDYWQRYGATLHGLMRHHGTDPRHFLHHTHQFPDLPAMVIKSQGLRHALRRVRGHKVVFTNAPMAYAEQVLRLLGIRDLFQAVFSIESARFRPKPAREGFLHILRTLRVPAHRCAMVEDSLPALRMAKRLGMKTIYVNPDTRRPSFVDVRIGSIHALPGAIF
ncbi:MAG: pyrimidine 5'-nucleotidase [Methylobacillus sp.]|jgi:putative hydrolase of the HAD superfamily|nr:pyrimidine 5'-nucleotidase [Methylobacillus sp.]